MIPTINPIRIAPSTLVIKVKKGNSVFKGIRLMAYRAIAPTAPPSATNKKIHVGYLLYVKYAILFSWNHVRIISINISKGTMSDSLILILNTE